MERCLVSRHRGYWLVAHHSKLNFKSIHKTGCPTLSALFAERVGGENANRTTQNISNLPQDYLRRSPEFPNWNQISRPTAFLLISSSTYDKISIDRLSIR
jgi:hypothetical protein